ncbi:MAG: hypothetical protein EOR99_33775 [Mesorhizobium sp.]|nr:MAG: hypothetical protein EOR99_33775 [Mesorhizobium sp.]
MKDDSHQDSLAPAYQSGEVDYDGHIPARRSTFAGSSEIGESRFGLLGRFGRVLRHPPLRLEFAEAKDSLGDLHKRSVLHRLAHGEHGRPVCIDDEKVPSTSMAYVDVKHGRACFETIRRAAVRPGVNGNTG